MFLEKCSQEHVDYDGVNVKALSMVVTTVTQP